MTLLLTDSESDASDDETDVPNAWTVDLARHKDEYPIAEQKIPLHGGDSIGIVFLFGKLCKNCIVCPGHICAMRTAV